jgi:hypothetical protein
MKCPNCESKNVIKVANKFYTCEDCCEPKFTFDEVNSINFDIKPFKTLDGYRIKVTNPTIKGWYKVVGINNTCEGNGFNKGKSLNDYKIVGASGKQAMMRVYDGDYQKHYCYFFINGEYITLEGGEFEIHEK